MEFRLISEQMLRNYRARQQIMADNNITNKLKTSGKKTKYATSGKMISECSNSSASDRTYLSCHEFSVLPLIGGWRSIFVCCHTDVAPGIFLAPLRSTMKVIGKVEGQRDSERRNKEQRENKWSVAFHTNLISINFRASNSETGFENVTGFN